MSAGSLTAALRETLDLFADSGQPLTTTEVAERLDVGRRSAYERLDRLVEHGELDTKKAGASARVWWRPEATERDRETERSDDARSDRFGALVDAIDEYAVFELDPDGRVRSWSDGARRLTGYAETEIVGEHVSTFYTDADRTAGVPATDLAAAASDGSIERQGPRVRADGSTFRSRVTLSALHDDGQIGGFVTVARDTADRHERERRLRREHDRSEERYRTLFESIDQGYCIVELLFDSDGEPADYRFVETNPAFVEQTGLQDAEGKRMRDLEPEHEQHWFDVYGDVALTGDPARFEAEAQALMDGWYDVHAVRVGDPDDHRVAVLFDDITERKERERELEEYRRWSRTLIENIPSGAVALVDDEFRYVTFGGTPEGDVDVTGADLEGNPVREVLPTKIVDVVVPSYEAALDGEASSFEDTIDGKVYEFHFVPVRDDDGDVFAATAMSQDVTDRVERERQLERQRERLAALNSLDGVVRDLSAAVIDQSTRAEIESIVCEQLAATDSYEFAWIGDVDAQTRTVRLRTEAGVEGYLDDITISVDPDDPRSAGPTGRAVRTQEMQVTEDVFEDDSYVPWREQAREHGFRSSAAIPIAHDGVRYGVLNVYADRPDAFHGAESEVIGHLAEVIGHAISAIEQNRALTSDEVAEFEFRIPDVLDALDLPASGDGRFTFDRVVPAGDDDYLVYGTATDGGLDVVEAFVETLDYWESVRRIGNPSVDALTRFELRLVDPPILSEVAALGGYLDRVVVEDDLYARIHLAPSADTRGLVELVRAEFPTARLTTQRQISRPANSPNRVSNVLAEHLTDRERAALEAGYFAGYFEWPRDSKGTEVAESLGVSPATYHQHLRNGHRKLLRIALDDPMAE